MSEYVKLEDAIEAVKTAIAEIDDTMGDIADYIIEYLDDLPTIEVEGE